MKFNWKIIVAVIVIGFAIFWGLSSSSTQSHNGTNLEFAIGGGSVTITNPSNDTLAVQLVGSGTRSFSVIDSSIETTGSSTRDGNGSSATQTYELEIPSGESQFSIARGKDVNFIATNTDAIQAIVQPLSAGESQTTLIAVTIIILASLFFISRTLEHLWLKQLMKKGQADPVETVAETKSSSQGNNLKSFGDNRSK